MSRSVCVAVVATCLVPLLPGAVSANDGRPVPRVAPKPEHSAADLRVLHEVAREAEVLAREGRGEAYLELLERTVGRLESPRLRRSLYDSIGLAHAEAGRKERAEAAYRAAIGTPGVRDSNYYHAVEALSRLLTGSGRAAEAESLCSHAIAGVGDPVRELSAVSDLCRSSECSVIHSQGARVATGALAAADLPPSERVGVTRRAASVLVLAGRPDEATAAMRALLEASGSDDAEWKVARAEAFRAAGAVASEMGGKGFRDESYDLTVWAAEACPELGDSPAYLGVLASRASSAGLRRDAIGYRTRLVERFPDDERVPEELPLLAEDFLGLGDRERAAAAYQAVIDHPKARPSQRGRAREDLAALEVKRR